MAYPQSPRYNAYTPYNAESFLPTEGRSLQRNSTYLRHIQSDLNIHRLREDLTQLADNALDPDRLYRRRQATPLKNLYIHDENIPVRPPTRQRYAPYSGGAVELETPAPTPRYELETPSTISPMSPHIRRIVSDPELTPGNGFIHTRRRSSGLPSIPSPDEQHAHHFHIWDARSEPASPNLSELDSQFPEVVPDQFHRPEVFPDQSDHPEVFPVQHHHPRVMPDHAYGYDEAPTEVDSTVSFEDREKPRRRFSRIVKKMFGFVSRKRIF